MCKWVGELPTYSQMSKLFPDTKSAVGFVLYILTYSVNVAYAHNIIVGGRSM